MKSPFRAVSVVLHRAEYCLLFPFVFCATYLEASPPERRDAIDRGVGSLVLMVAGLLGVNIIRVYFS